MPLVLAIDTGAELASLALVSEKGVEAEAAITSGDGFAHVLFPEIERLLSLAGRRLDEVDCFAAAAGPGSFTGVRVALSAAKGLAETMGRPMAAVSNLQALALHGSAPLRAPVIDARRGQVYRAIYNERLECVEAESVGPLGEWQASLGRDVELVQLEAHAGLAAAVGRIALRRYLDGEAVDPAATDANYVRRSDAELNWSE